MLTLVETPIWLKLAEALFSEEDYRRFQLYIAKRPDMGALIQRSGGIRKMRWARPGQGKSSGYRVYYYVATHEGRIFLLYVHTKAAQEALNAAQIQRLRAELEL